METATSNILIGGTSHVGKSTLSAFLGTALNCEVVSADKMARHPGRPWPRVRPHIAEFYNSLSADSIYAFLLHHHQNMWPSIKKIAEDGLNAQTYLIIEGSALRPEYLSEFAGSKSVCLCLYAPAELIQSRIHANSNYRDLPPHLRSLVDVFIERSVTDNETIARSATEHDIELINVADQVALRQLKNELVGATISKQ